MTAWTHHQSSTDDQWWLRTKDLTLIVWRGQSPPWWSLTCPQLGITALVLLAQDAEEAKREAVERVRKKLEAMMRSVEEVER